MNFETKHLVRWGIPGWTLIMILGPYLLQSFHSQINSMASTLNLLALGAFLTVIGVPLGYLLNQIHHSVTWVMVRGYKPLRELLEKEENWDDFFKSELKLDEFFFKDVNGDKYRERYQYLLSRKHELGGLTVSLFISSISIIVLKFSKQGLGELWSWIYMIIVLILFILILISRLYSSRNIDKYYYTYLEKEIERKK